MAILGKMKFDSKVVLILVMLKVRRPEKRYHKSKGYANNKE